ncbi:MAG: hypothetical protein AAB426_09720 [Myxococcota bacterium]
MVEPAAQHLQRLAAQLLAKTRHIQQTVDEIEHAKSALEGGTIDRLGLYGTAALLETFYTGVEKAMGRIASVLGGMPEGPMRHRTLL